MNKRTVESQLEHVATKHQKLNIFSAGGKGGVGKTTLMVALAEWLIFKEIFFALLDLDTENSTKGGLQYHLKGATKVNIRKQTGLDVFLDILDRDERVVLSDMGAGQGQVTTDWFDAVYEELQPLGVGFLAVCLVTPDPASIDSTLQWAASLQDRVNYLVVLNEMGEPEAPFSLWQASKKAQEFRDRFNPAIMKMASRPSEFQELLSNHGVTLNDVAERRTKVEALMMARNVIHAKRHRRLLFAEFDRVVPQFLPSL